VYYTRKCTDFGSTTGTLFQRKAIAENVEEVHLKKTTVIRTGRKGIKLFEIRDKQAKKPRIAHGLWKEPVDNLTGIAGITDFLKVIADAGKNVDNVSIPETGEAFFQNHLEVQAGKYFKGSAETFDALFSVAHKCTDLSVLAGEQCNNPVALAIIHCGKHNGLAFMCQHAGTLSLPIAWPYTTS
jgi:hypothetical protein